MARYKLCARPLLPSAAALLIYTFPPWLVVDCNEDGFTYDNLKAISAVGQSSKTGARGYIGEKGIGFKSVFMAAWKVTIQSGDFSFYFKHHRDDKGSGMVRPRWIDLDEAEALEPNMTRMTLLLHRASPEEMKEQQEMIRQQLNGIQESLLLSTQNLKEIRVTLFDEDDDIERELTFRG